VSVDSWTNVLNVSTAQIPRASRYLWTFYGADGVTVVHTYTTAVPQYGYTATQAALDGVRRQYQIGVQGVNLAGAGTRSATLANVSLPPPAALASVSASGGAYNGEVTATPQAGAVGYIAVISTTSGFNPATSGAAVLSPVLPVALFGLAAGTWYARLAAYDLWTFDVALLNVSAEVNFTITTGQGASPSGGGNTLGSGGAGGGGGGVISQGTYVNVAED
jgi:hypothetical protein